MFRNPGFRRSVLAVCGLHVLFFQHAAPAGARQAAQLPEKPEQHQHGHEMNVPSGARTMRNEFCPRQ
jgi:hypothetical protein